MQILFPLSRPTVTSVEDCLACAHDSDGSPPGCLSIGSTGQVVIHVYGRTSHQGNEFTIRVLSLAELIPFSRGRRRCSHFVLFDFYPQLLSADTDFPGRKNVPAEGELSGVAGSINFSRDVRKRQLTTDHLQIASTICCSAVVLFPAALIELNRHGCALTAAMSGSSIAVSKTASTHTSLRTPRPHARACTRPSARNHLLMVAEPW